ncbi:hypothetical protein EBQ81_05090 [bacterium]|nr:hypothetical protein [bacterium]
MIYFKKLWNSIVNYFKIAYGITNNNTDNSKLNITTTNSIKFEIDEWNRFILTIRIENANIMACEEFGKMLYLLNDGRYDQKILEVLVELGKNKELPMHNIQQIMSGWTTLLATEMDQNNSPYIKPTEVFNNK